MAVEVEEIKLDIKQAKYRIWNKEKKKWFYVVEKQSSFPVSQFLVSEDDDVILAISLKNSPWIWGRGERLR